MEKFYEENRLRQVTDPHDLITYQTEEAKRHNNYYHYTVWSSLEKIMHGKSFLLTRVDALFINDLEEAKDRDADMCSRTYIASFAFGTSEIMPMWGLYCLPPSDAVRVCIPKQAMLDWVDSIKSVTLWDDGKELEKVEGVEVTLLDIVYGDGLDGSKPNLTHNGKHFNASKQDALHELFHNKDLVGNIKSFAWSYENEVRLKIVLPKKAAAEKIMVKIPDKVVNNFFFTTGPHFAHKGDALYEKLKEWPKEAQPPKNKEKEDQLRITDSKFTGLLNYRTLCSVCAHGSFEKKQETSQK